MGVREPVVQGLGKDRGPLVHHTAPLAECLHVLGDSHAAAPFGFRYVRGFKSGEQSFT